MAYLWEKFVLKCALPLMRASALQKPRMAIMTGDYISLRMLLQGQFERKELELLDATVFNRGFAHKICLDIGANIGNHAVAFSRWFEKVYAFEPNPRCFDILQVNAKWAGNVTPFCVGASDRSCTVSATAPPGNLGALRISNDAATVGTESVTFDCVRLDDFLADEDLDRVGFIKVDVEGHEQQALSGCERIILRSRPLISFERLREDVRSSAHALLEGYGYKHFYDVGAGLRLIRSFKERNYKMILASPRPLDVS